MWLKKNVAHGAQPSVSRLLLPYFGLFSHDNMESLCICFIVLYCVVVLIDDDAKRSREKSVRMLVYDYQIIILFNYDIIFKILCSIILFDLWDPRTRLGGW